MGTKHKPHKPHVVTTRLGQPVKGRQRKRPDDALRSRGRQPADPELRDVPPEQTTVVFVRATWTERRAWEAAAAASSPDGKVTIGPWARRALNRAAGIGSDEK